MTLLQPKIHVFSWLFLNNISYNGDSRVVKDIMLIPHKVTFLSDWTCSNKTVRRFAAFVSSQWDIQRPSNILQYNNYDKCPLWLNYFISQVGTANQAFFHPVKVPLRMRENFWNTIQVFLFKVMDSVWPQMRTVNAPVIS